MHQVRLFFIALQFFTRLPIPAWVGFDSAWLQPASRYFPLIGVVVAAAAAAVYAAAAALWSPMVAAVLSTAAGVYLTGAFHEDGFADTCDGMGGGLTRERVLEIMHDSRIGTYGALGMGLIVGLKCALLASMPGAAALAALFVAHPLSRLAAVALIWRLDYVRGEGKAKPMANTMSGAEFAIAAVCAALPAALAGASGHASWVALGASVAGAALAALWLGAKFTRRIGGYTGDCLGAVQQVSEVVIYLALAAAIVHA